MWIIYQLNMFTCILFLNILYPVIGSSYGWKYSHSSEHTHTHSFYPSLSLSLILSVLFRKWRHFFVAFQPQCTNIQGMRFPVPAYIPGSSLGVANCTFIGFKQTDNFDLARYFLSIRKTNSCILLWLIRLLILFRVDMYKDLPIDVFERSISHDKNPSHNDRFWQFVFIDTPTNYINSYELHSQIWVKWNSLL